MSQTQSEHSGRVRPAPTPIVKWVGGKGRLLTQLAALQPQDVDQMRHVEPFAGGAAMFFASRSERALLSDVNGNLMKTYVAVRDDVAGVLAHLEALERTHCSEQFYTVRSRYNAAHFGCGAEHAAAFIYLNKTCFNGLYRVNKAGCFNVPLGRYAKPRIADAEGLQVASVRLRKAELGVGGFESALKRVQKDDFVYLDPPYDSALGTGFHRYDREGFSRTDQLRLRTAFDAFVRKGAHVMLSNSDTPYVRSLYRGLSVVEVNAPRSISRCARGRRAVRELVVRSYG